MYAAHRNAVAADARRIASDSLARILQKLANVPY